jgi:hypothetical protein
LTPLGYLTKELLAKATESKLLNIQAGMYFETPTDKIYFHSSEHAPQGLPEELERQIAEFNSADEIVRMGRCVRGIPHLLIGDFYEEEIPSRTRKLAERGEIPPEIERCMQNITRWRNKIEHSFGYSISSSILESLRECFLKVG